MLASISVNIGLEMINRTISGKHSWLRNVLRNCRITEIDDPLQSRTGADLMAACKLVNVKYLQALSTFLSRKPKATHNYTLKQNFVLKAKIR